MPWISNFSARHEFANLRACNFFIGGSFLSETIIFLKKLFGKPKHEILFWKITIRGSLEFQHICYLSRAAKSRFEVFSRSDIVQFRFPSKKCLQAITILVSETQVALFRNYNRFDNTSSSFCRGYRPMKIISAWWIQASKHDTSWFLYDRLLKLITKLES